MNIEIINSLVEKSSELTRSALIIFYAICIYILLIIISTNDLQLLIPNSNVKLPILDIEISIDKFYFIAPILLLILHYNLMFQFFLHTQKLNLLQSFLNANSKMSDLQSLTYPFIFNHLYFFSSGNLAGKLQRIVGEVAIFLFPFLIFVVLQHRYSDYHSIWSTFFHFCSSILDAVFIYSFYPKLFNSNVHSSEIPLISIENSKPLPPNKTLNSKKKLVYYFIQIRIGMLKIYNSIDFLKNFVLYILLTSLLLSLFNLILIGLMNSNRQITNRKIIEKIMYFPTIEVTEALVVSNPRQEDLVNQYLRHGKILNQKEIDFTFSIDLKGRNLVCSKLDKSILVNCDFRGANLSFSSLEGCNLSYSDFRSSNIKFTNLSHSIAKHTNFSDSTNGYQSIFRECDLSDTKICLAYFNKADFTGANLQRAIINNSIIQEASFEFADIRGANITGSTFFGSNFQNAKAQAIQSFNQVNIPGYIKVGMGADLSFVDFFNADLSASQLYSSWFIGANLNQARIMWADLPNSKFIGSSLESTNFNSSNLSDSDLTGSYISNANFINTNLTNTKMDSLAFTGDLASYVGYNEEHLLNEILPFIKPEDSTKIAVALELLGNRSESNLEHFTSNIKGWLSIRDRWICGQNIPMNRIFLHPSSNEAAELNKILYLNFQIKCPNYLSLIDTVKFFQTK